VNQVFSKGSVSYTWEPNNLVIAYEDEVGKCLCRVNFPIATTSRRDFDELKYCVQDFLLDCFYTYEYEHITSGWITLKALSIIMGVDHRSVFDEVVLIEAEIIRKFNEMFQLWEELAEKGVIKKSPWLTAMYRKVKELV